MRALIATSVLLLGACATPCPPPPARGPVVAHYRCDTLETFTVTFTSNPDRARIEQQGYETVMLPAVPAGSGFRYEANGLELRGQGVEARLTRPGAGERLCRQRD